jgi:hypothetical protein
MWFLTGLKMNWPAGQSIPYKLVADERVTSTAPPSPTRHGYQSHSGPDRSSCIAERSALWFLHNSVVYLLHIGVQRSAPHSVILSHRPVITFAHCFTVRLLVAWIMILDTFHTACTIYMLWDFTVTNFGNFAVFTRSSWVFPTTPIFSAHMFWIHVHLQVITSFFSRTCFPSDTTFSCMANQTPIQVLDTLLHYLCFLFGTGCLRVRRWDHGEHHRRVSFCFHSSCADD